MGSVARTLAGVLLLGLIFNVLNFENGLGWISLSAYWQSVVRGVFLMIVVMAGSGGGPPGHPGGLTRCRRRCAPRILDFKFPSRPAPPSKKQ